MAFADLTGRVALVTGGTRGIGKATAALLKAQGAEVIVHGSRPQTVEAAAAELGVRGIAMDLCTPGSAAELAKQALEMAGGRVDILVNNAGLARDGLFVRLTPAQWEEVMTVNVMRVVELSRALVPTMMKQNYGRIVNLTSVVGHMGNMGQTNYITSKAAITGFTKALAMEVARKHITVNAVAPGFIATDMTADMTEAAKEALLKQIPVQRLGEADDVARAIAFLASTEAAYITGTTLHVNGGMFVG